MIVFFSSITLGQRQILAKRANAAHRLQIFVSLSPILAQAPCIFVPESNLANMDLVFFFFILANVIACSIVGIIKERSSGYSSNHSSRSYHDDDDFDSGYDYDSRSRSEYSSMTSNYYGKHGEFDTNDRMRANMEDMEQFHNSSSSFDPYDHGYDWDEISDADNDGYFD